MLFSALLSVGLVAGAHASSEFINKKHMVRDMDDLDVDLYTDTNKHCEDDVEIKLRWEHPADLDLIVEGPDMCQITWRNRLSKWGGILEEDAIPETCHKRDGPWEEIVRYGNGVANGGIWAIYAHYYSDGHCDTGPVDFTITVTMGGKRVDTFRGVLKKIDDASEIYYVLGHRAHPTRKHTCAIRRVLPKPPVKPVRKPVRRVRRKVDRVRKDRDVKKRRHLLSHEVEHKRKVVVKKPVVKKETEELKCVCFHGKAVRRRGQCIMKEEEVMMEDRKDRDDDRKDRH